MVITDVVEIYKSKNEGDVKKFFSELAQTIEFEEKKYDPKDITDTVEYLERRKEILEIARAKSNGWKYISEHVELPLEFIREYSIKLYWGALSYNIPYDEEFISEFADKLNWKVLFLKYTFSKEFLYKYQDKIRYSIIMGE